MKKEITNCKNISSINKFILKLVIIRNHLAWKKDDHFLCPLFISWWWWTQKSYAKSSSSFLENTGWSAINSTYFQNKKYCLKIKIIYVEVIIIFSWKYRVVSNKQYFQKDNYCKRIRLKTYSYRSFQSTSPNIPAVSVNIVLALLFRCQ